MNIAKTVFPDLKYIYLKKEKIGSFLNMLIIIGYLVGKKQQSSVFSFYNIVWSNCTKNHLKFLYISTNIFLENFLKTLDIKGFV